MKYIPLAARIRPQSIDEIVGQEHLLSQHGVLTKILAGDGICSLVLCGKPGVGKTSLARIIASSKKLEFFELSAVDSGVKDVKKIIADNQHLDSFVLFLDEIHRFNKSQQDLLFPYVESGKIVLIGATTENPTYYLNNALVSRLFILRLKRLSISATQKLIQRALSQDEVLAKYTFKIDDGLYNAIHNYSEGDCRKILNLIERMFLISDRMDEIYLNKELFDQAVGEASRDFHREGKEFYEQLSAFHKSVRGTDADAAIFWLSVMLDNGVDPLVIARRMLCIASEDIGNADPQALRVAIDAWNAYEKLGLPEGRLVLAQAAIYLAVAPKSNACYKALAQAQQLVKNLGDIQVPQHLKNYKDSNYLYPHNYPNSYVIQQYLPKNVVQTFYQPSASGFETKIKTKLDSINKIKKL
ncbi:MULTISPECIES: AAA family ATPase [Francisella]|uniref:Replication-associated recombination protein A n=1 Tax=Francisella opportunistica TaxID=2016517 RepID=A0A345JQ37_9GAMM|nr:MULTISPECIES: AAA family ATPase [Francisella]APC91126.1 ATPase, AAA family [Francisella sp. MA067296]AXH29433.1 recombination factor protein RarA [Francisella opportunistica]AXH31085.1 recombination factor protein RarA [Francisella opportunistica]AXH32730.1 recombination factor protein RarA [Francisella opportunistica]